MLKLYERAVRESFAFEIKLKDGLGIIYLPGGFEPVYLINGSILRVKVSL